MSLDLSKFGLGEMLRCSMAVRRSASGATSMEDAARKVCAFFYEELRAPDGNRACVLVRAYKVQPFGRLPKDLQRFATRALKSDSEAPAPTDSMPCLTLLATVGDEAGWNERHLSKGHQAIPLASSQMVHRAPMISQLFRDFGLEAADIVEPSENTAKKLQGKTYGVFHVEEAAGSPHIPAQAQFVERYGVRSVLGFGGAVVGTELFAVILFTRTPVSAAAADRFRTIALDVKGALLPFSDGPIFVER